MKKIFSFLLAFLLLSSQAFATNKLISDLTSDASPTDDDLIETLDSPSGTPASHKVTMSDLSTYILAKSWAGSAIDYTRGGTGLTTAPDDNLMVGSGIGWQLKALPNCADSSGNHLNYTASTNSFSCGTSSSSGVVGSDTQFIFNDGGSTLAGATAVTYDKTINASSGVETVFKIAPTISQSSTGGYDAVIADVTESSTGSGHKYLFSGKVGGAYKYFVDDTGAVTATSFITSSTSAGSIQLNEASANGSNFRKFTVASSLSADATITLDGTDATTQTFPSTSQTLMGKTSTDTMTNKTYDTAGSGNVFKINGTSITAISGNAATAVTTTGSQTNNAFVLIDSSGNHVASTTTTYSSNRLAVSDSSTSGAGIAATNTNASGYAQYYATNDQGHSGGIIATGSSYAVPDAIGAGSFSAVPFVFFVNSTPLAKFSTNNNFEFTGTTPTVASCGTSPSIITKSTNNAGAVQVGSVSATSCVVTFAGSGFTNAPFCTATDDTSIIAVKAVSTTTTLTLSSTVLTGDKVTWNCWGGY